MDKQVQKIRPNYKQIYLDILTDKFPEKLSVLEKFLKKKNFSSLDVIHINQLIFGNSKGDMTESHKHRSYRKSDILQILKYQQENNLSNMKVAHHFKISRNTISKWKKEYKLIKLSS